MIRLIVPKVCRDCGKTLFHVETWEEHYRFCPGPTRLVFEEDGIYGEVFD